MTRTALSLRDRRVNACRPVQVRLKIAVALDAEGFLSLDRDSLEITGMGIVTGETVPLLKGGMQGNGPFLFHELRMAGGAEFRPGCLEELRLIAAMAEMTGGALAVLYGLMDIGLEELALKFGMACVADLVRPGDENFLGAGAMGVVAAGAHLLGIR